MRGPFTLDRTSKLLVNIGTALVLWCNGTNLADAANNLSYDSQKQGPTLQNPINVYLIYWMPGGVEAYPGAVSGMGNFDLPIGSFFGNVSGSAYLNIATQYPGACGSNQCVVQNVIGAVNLAGDYVDTRAYPHAGTQRDPLQDSDIQDEVRRSIAQKKWSVDPNNAFFVITGVFQATGRGVEECVPNGNCTFNAFCGYHASFGFNGNTVHYAYLSDASFNAAGCNEGINSAIDTHDLSSDRELALMTHEFVEMITDPIPLTAWYDPQTQEIGDKCNQQPFIVDFNGNRFFVQQQWSNATSSCVSSLPTVTRISPSSGPTTGGTPVEVDGALFGTTGGTQITFGGTRGTPASGIRCPSSTQCFATSPSIIPSGNGVAEVLPVLVTVGGLTSDPRPPGSNFTYTAGPSCTSALSCAGHPFGFPDLVVQCPSPVNFYQLAGTPDQAFVGSGTSYAFNTNDTPNVAAACLPSGGSCTSFSLYEASDTYCGTLPPPPPNFCEQCKKTDGICTTGPGGKKYCIHQ